jgi:circadian clock protein KaiC
VVKSRGMSHSNQVREFLLTDNGIDLVDVYTGSGRVLTGSARIAQEAETRATATLYREEKDLMERTLGRKQKALEAKVEAIRAEFDADAAEMSMEINERAQRVTHLTADRDAMIRVRQADVPLKTPVKNLRLRKSRIIPRLEKKRA